MRDSELRAYSPTKLWQIDSCLGIKPGNSQISVKGVHETKLRNIPCQSDLHDKFNIFARFEVQIRSW